MDKYSQDDDTLRLGLIDEEAQLMRAIGNFMSTLEKTAEEEREHVRAERRLLAVRAKLREIEQKQVKGS